MSGLNPDEQRLNEKARQRGKILLILSVCFPDPMSFTDLFSEMVSAQAQILDSRDLAFHIGYLRDRGHLKTEKLRAGRSQIEMQTVCITARGIDYVDGRLDRDPGVII